MPVSRCRECGAEFALGALSCPRCGAPRPVPPPKEGTGIDLKLGGTVLGFPLVHIAFGRDGQGRMRVAKGVIAIGQFAMGVITIAQFGVGILFGFGQFVLAFVGVGQIAITGLFGLGQLVVGYVAIGQLVLATYGLAQTGWAHHMWSPSTKDPAAVEFFRHLWQHLAGLSHGRK